LYKNRWNLKIVIQRSGLSSEWEWDEFDQIASLEQEKELMVRENNVAWRNSSRLVE
jgi:hypothetical protein